MIYIIYALDLFKKETKRNLLKLTEHLFIYRYQQRAGLRWNMVMMSMSFCVKMRVKI